jgi:hypothetical protein
MLKTFCLHLLYCVTIPQSALEQYEWRGTLRETEDGFVYVDLDDAYIHELIRYIEPYGFIEPPYFGKPGLVGAHISLFYSGEKPEGGLEEIGQEISFTPTTTQTVKPPSWENIDEVFILEVDSPELEEMRKKYGLEKREIPFHITIGVKPS